MKALYLQLLELLSEIPELRYVEQNYGQVTEEKPSIAYPAALITMNIHNVVEYEHLFIELEGSFEIMLVYKIFGETNSLTPAQQRTKSLAYYDVQEKIYKKLQGWKNDQFSPFSFRGATDQQIRKGLKTLTLRFETSWKEDIAS